MRVTRCASLDGPHSGSDLAGIPYKRSLLFHGLPGSGKTSLVQALAGRYGLSLCYLQPSEEDMTDSSLKDALQELPAKPLAVLSRSLQLVSRRS